jgi:hypothetical protein
VVNDLEQQGMFHDALQTGDQFVAMQEVHRVD